MRNIALFRRLTGFTRVYFKKETCGTRIRELRAMGRYPKNITTSVYVVQINGKAVVAFAAISYAEARELIKERWFLIELKSGTSGGVRLLDDQAKLSIRAATLTEIEATADVLSNSSQVDGLALAYLIKLDAAAALEGPDLS
jgi:hypothetical protein